MMRTLFATLPMFALAACVAGNPLSNDPSVDFNGGTITPPGCAYTMTTRVGAEAPALPEAGAVIGVDPGVKHVHLGIAGDPRTSMVVSWRTLDDTTKAGKVVFGIGGALTSEAPGITFSYKSGFTGDGVQVQLHEAHLCGLTADTVYDYQVVSDAGHASPTYHFRTAPDLALTPDAEIVIATVGDSRDGYAIWAQLIQQFIARAPDLVLFSGDAVTLGQLQPEWEEFFDLAEPLFANVPVMSVHGNHDLNAINFYSQFAMPGDEEDFSFDYGYAHIVVVNDSPEQLDDLSAKIPAFLTSDLTAHADARWKIVNHHRPIYSSSTSHGSDLLLRADWGPIFDQAHVDLVLNGHDHDYERSKPMRAGQVQASPADGTIYLVSGGAGAELYENGNDFWTQTSASLHSGASVRVRRELLEVQAFDETGAPVDSFTIDKP
jgi:hypothetical protein